jgi:hypothetical protein
MISRLTTTALLLLVMAAPAMANVTFTDGTFSPVNYTTTPVFLTDPVNSSFVSGQCTVCGNPGLGQFFSMNQTITPTGVPLGAETIINTTFSYNPTTQGAITSISASVDKNLGVNVAGTGFGNTFRPTIQQGGLFYAAAIVGPSLTTGPGGGFTGYNTIANTSLTAADFVQYDPTTSTFGTAHPNFAGGAMLFGLTQQFGAGAIETITAEYDNLDFVIATPEPAGLLVLGAGFAGLLVLRRRA